MATAIKVTIMQIGKASINACFRVSKASRKSRIPTIYNFAVIYPWNLPFFKKGLLFSIFFFFSAYKQNFMAQEISNLAKISVYLFLLKWWYICHYVICITVPLNMCYHKHEILVHVVAHVLIVWKYKHF